MYLTNAWMLAVDSNYVLCKRKAHLDVRRACYGF